MKYEEMTETKWLHNQYLAGDKLMSILYQYGYYHFCLAIIFKTLSKSNEPFEMS